MRADYSKLEGFYIDKQGIAHSVHRILGISAGKEFLFQSSGLTISIVL